MLFINIKKLDYIDCKYYYHKELFTGIGFTTNEDKVENLYEYETGNRLKAYQNEYFPISIDNHVVIDAIEFTGEFLDAFALYKNERFSGVAYELEGEEEFCLGQHLIEDGLTVASVCWYHSGQKESLKLDQGNLVQDFEWFNDGTIKKMSLFERPSKKTLIAVALSTPQKIKSVRIESNYFNSIMQYKPQLKYHYFEAINSFDDYAVNDTLSLIDKGVDDFVFNALASKNGFKDITAIIISNTSLSKASILKLANFKYLTQITFTEDKDDIYPIVQELKHLIPDCLIKLNHQLF